MSNAASLPVARGRATVNGFEMDYEVHGRGDGVPLVPLDGGNTTIDATFGRVLGLLAAPG